LVSIQKYVPNYLSSHFQCKEMFQVFRGLSNPIYRPLNLSPDLDQGVAVGS
jgi:hypothetical protein